MSSSEFAPLLGDDDAGRRGFHAFGTGMPAVPAAEARPTAASAEPSEETRRAFQAGYDLGREETRSQLESVAESFVKALEELAEFRARLRDRYERELLELALGVARKVVHHELAERPAIWLGMIRAAVQRAVDRERIRVRVPPALLAFLRDALPELRASLGDVKELTVVEDPALPETGCVVESQFGEIDAGLDTQLDACRRALVGTEE
jgi:flagellar assembly protein FliH